MLLAATIAGGLSADAAAQALIPSPNPQVSFAKAASATAVVRDDFGNGVLFYSISTTGVDNVFFRTFDSVPTLSGESVVGSSSAFSVFVLKADVNPTGNGVVVWGGTDTNGTGVQFRRFSTTGGMTGPVGIANFDEIGAQLSPDVAVADDGSFIVSYASLASGGGTNAAYRRFDPAGAPLDNPEVFLTANPVGTSASVPRVGVDASGNFAVGYVQTSGGSAVIHLDRFDPAGVQQGPTIPIPIPPAAGGLGIPITALDLEMDSCGNVYVSAEANLLATGKDTYIYKVDTSNVVAGPFLANDPNALGENHSAISVDIYGNSVIQWNYSTPVPSGEAVGSVFNSALAKILSDVQTSITVPGSRHLTSSGFLDNGGVFHAAYVQFDAFGSPTTVFLRKFTASVFLTGSCSGDTTPPTAVCQNITVPLNAAGTASITGADVDGGSTDNIGVTSLSAFPNSFTCADVGPQTVTLTVQDAAGNSATCTATVNVVDNVAPVALCQDIDIALGPGGTVTIVGADVDNGSSDACGIASLSVSPDTFDASDLGPNPVVLTVTDNFGNPSTCNATVTVVKATPTIITGADNGPAPEPQIGEFVSDSSGGADPTFRFDAYHPGFIGGVRVASGDVNNDGFPDIITAPGPGVAPQVKVFDGVTGAQLADFQAYTPSFTGGVFVAAGDVNGDGHADIITGAGPGSNPHVKVFDGTNTAVELASFFAYTSGFTGGVRVASGDVNGDGTPDIITAPGQGGGPHVRIFDGTNTVVELDSFQAYPVAFTGGVFVAAGDVNGDGRADIITGAGPGAGPHVKVFDARDTASELANFFAYPLGFNGGVRVASGDVDGDGFADIITGAGPGATPHVRVFDGTNASVELAQFFAYAPSFTGGVFVSSPPLPPLDPGTDTTVAGIGDRLCIFDAASATDDNIEISIVGANLRVFDPTHVLQALGGATQIDPNTVEYPRLGLTSVKLETGDGDDTATVRWSAGNPQFPAAIGFEGGGNGPGGDQLVLAGGDPFFGAVFNYDNANDGSVEVGTTTITYTGLEPVTSTITAANVTLNYSAAVDNITITDGGGGSTTVDSNAAEITTFTNPTTSLTINAGDGDDVIDVVSLGGGFAAALTINGQGDTDMIDYTALTGPLASLALIAEQIEIDVPGSITTTGSQNYNGPVTVRQQLTLFAGTGAIFSSSLELDAPNVNFVGGASSVQGGVFGTGDVDLFIGTLNLANTGVLQAHTGALNVFGGTMFANDLTTASANVIAGTLAGRGNIGGPVVNNNAVISPGSSPGRLSTGDISGPGNQVFEIDGTTPASGHDQIRVTGTVDLTGAFILLSGTHVPQVGERFVLIDNDGVDPVNGIFTGYPEDFEFPFNGSMATITYTGGTGNDVVLAETTASISNFVWEDLNANGFQDSGEPGLDGVRVDLMDAAGAIQLDTTITAGGGFYSFDGITTFPVTHRIRVHPPVAPLGSEPYEFTRYQTSNLARNSDIPAEFSLVPEMTDPIVLGPGDRRTDIDAGFFRRVPIEGFVWRDVNCDGLQDFGEPALPNVEVILRNVTQPGPHPSMFTNGAGVYAFPPQIPGNITYQIQVRLPAPGVPEISQFTIADAPGGSNANDVIDSDISIFTGTIFPNSGRAPNLSPQSGQTVVLVDAGMKDVTPPTPTIVCGIPDGGCSPVDTVVHRIELDEPARLRMDPPVPAVDIELVQLSLVSLQPVNVPPGPGVFDTEWDLTVMANAEAVPASVRILPGAFLDASNNPGNGSNSCEFVYDATPPDVTCTPTAPGLDLTPQTALTSVSPLVFTVLFNEDVTGVDPTDFTVTGPGASVLSVFPGAGPETSYVLELAVTVAGVYEVGWAAPTPDWIEDCAGNDFLGSANTALTEFIVVGTQVGNRVRALDYAPGDRFGWSVAVNAETAIVGSPNDDDNGSSSGSAYVFERDGASSMTEVQKLLAVGGAFSDQFGYAVAIRGDRAVVGVPNDDEVNTNTGAVYVFDRDPVTRIWGAGLKLLPPPGTAFNGSVGRAVDVFGDTVVAGAPRAGTFYAGQVIVWERDPCTGTWSVAAVLEAFDSARNDALGTSVAIDRQRILAGAPGDDDNGNSTGAVYSFVRSSGVWMPELGAAKMIPPAAVGGDRIGEDVALRGDTAIIGAPGDDDNGTNTGAVYAMEPVGILGWLEIPGSKMIAGDVSPLAGLGSSVDFDGATVAAGAPTDRTSGTDAGAMYAFEAGTWNQLGKFLTPETGSYDDLGFSVGISGRNLMGGAPDTAADPGTVPVRRVGAAYFHQLP